MYLENDTLKLRALEPEDIDMLYRWENLPEYWSAGNTRKPWSRFALKEYLRKSTDDLYVQGQLRLMIQEKEAGNCVGTVDLFDFDLHHSRVAIGLFVAPEFQGRGYARQSVKMMEKYVFEFLKINQLYCQIGINNHSSRKLFENLHYDKSVLKQWISVVSGFEDVVVYQQFKADFERRNQGT